MATRGEIEEVLKLRDEMSGKLADVQKVLGNTAGEAERATKAVAGKEKSLRDLGNTAVNAVPGLRGVVSSIGSVGSASGAVVSAIGAAVTLFALWTRETIALGSQLTDLAAKSGLSTDAVQELGFAANLGGIGVDVLTNAVTRLGRRAAEGIPSTMRGLRDLGITAQEIVDAKPEDAFLRVAEAIGKIESPAKQAQLAMAIMGDQGLQILPLIRSDVGLAVEEFRALGAVIDEDVLAAADQLDDKLVALGATWKALKAEATAPFIETLNDMTGATLEWIKAQREAKREFDLATASVRDLDKVASLMPPVLRQNTDEHQKLSVGVQVTASELRKLDKEWQEFVKTNEKAKAAVETHRKEIENLANQLGTGGLEERMGKINEAIEALGGISQVSSNGLKMLSAMFRELDANLIAPTGHLADFKARMDDLNTISPELNDRLMEAEQAFEFTEEDVARFNETLGELNAKKLPELLKKTEQSTGLMDKWSGALSQVRGLFNLLGVSADNVFAKIVGWLTKITDTANAVLGVLGGVLGLFRGGGGGGLGGILGQGGGLGSLLGGLFGRGAGAGGFVPAVAGIGDLGLGAGGAAAGGGGGLLGSLGALFTNPLTAIIGGGIGAFFGLRALLGKQASAESTSEAMGIDFGALSKSLQSTLQDMGKQIGDFATSIQLNLGQVFGEGGLGRNFDLLAEKMADSFSFLDRGQFDATQTQRVLNDTVAQLLPNIDQLGVEGVLQLERLFAASERTGVGFAGMAELAKAYVQRANELGIAVNDVVLQALGLSEALGITGAAGEGAFSVAEGAIAGASGAISNFSGELDEVLSKMREVGGVTMPGGGNGGGLPVLPGAQHGMDAIVRRPSLIPVGEGGRPERVTVTPMAQMGNFGFAPNITIVQQQMSVEALIDAVDDGLRRGVKGARERFRKRLGVP